MQEKPPQRCRPLEGLRILLTDEMPAWQHIYSVGLARAGAIVTIASDGDMALYLWKSVAPTDAAFEAVIVSYDMLGVDGAYVTAALRDVGFTGLIIGIATEVSQSEAQQWIENGCSEILEKGVSIADFVSCVVDHARRKD